MPSYFFSLKGDPDTTEVDLSDDRAAWSEAARYCGEFIREMDGKLPSDARWQLDVLDASGRTVALLTFSAQFVPEKKQA